MMWMMMALTIVSAITTACVSLSRRRRRTGSLETTRDSGATPSPWVPRECPLPELVVVQACRVPRLHRLRHLGFAVPLPRHEDRRSTVQGVHEVAGTRAAPEVKTAPPS